jgi:hypothetical protein
MEVETTLNFMEVETTLNGATLRGFALAGFLKPTS